MSTASPDRPARPGLAALNGKTARAVSLFLAFCCGLCLGTDPGRAATAVPALPQSGASMESFMPMGWRVNSSATGDLNKDGNADIAAVFELPDNGENPPARALVLLFSGDGGYTLSAANFAVAPWTFCSGVEIRNGVVILSGYDGGTHRDYDSFKFRWQDNGWRLIGATTGGFESSLGSGVEYDYNLLTGKAEQSETDNGARGAPVPLKSRKKPPIFLKDIKNIDVLWKTIRE